VEDDAAAPTAVTSTTPIQIAIICLISAPSSDVAHLLGR
jgi:hypothetical protein